MGLSAIYIQSFHKEINDGRLLRLLRNIIQNRFYDLEIVVFVDESSLKADLTSLIGVSNLIRLIAIEDQIAFNPITRIFHFMMNFEVDLHQQVLLLESDCVLLKHFDKIIDENVTKMSTNEWFIYGSTYGGNKWKHVSDKTKDYSDHMNGVAVYNRTPEFLQHLNQVFINRGLEDLKVNYDFAYYESIKTTYKKRCIDSPFISNISDPDDQQLHHKNIKPNAVIIHTKNKYYTLLDNIENLLVAASNTNYSAEETRKIPAFLHIPKCAGTYIESALISSLTWYGRNQKQWEMRFGNNINLQFRKIQLKFNDGSVALSFLVYDYNDIILSSGFFNEINPYIYSAYLEEFLQHSVELNFFIFALIIHSPGAWLLTTNLFKALSLLFNVDFCYFTLLRDPFSKAQSMYNYLTSANSCHELTHKAIVSETFNDYVSSYEIEDCWLIRQLTNIKNNEIIQDEFFEKTTTVLDKFVIEDVKNANLMLEKIIFDCYKIEYSNIPDVFKERQLYNKTSYKETITIDCLTADEKTAFLQRTSYDQKLYQKYCK